MDAEAMPMPLLVLVLVLYGEPPVKDIGRCTHGSAAAAHLRDEGHRPYPVAGGVGGPHALRAGPGAVPGVLGREHPLARGPHGRRVALEAEVGQGEQRGGVGVVDHRVVPKAVGLVGVDQLPRRTARCLDHAEGLDAGLMR
jgi:hypothetical protein